MQIDSGIPIFLDLFNEISNANKAMSIRLNKRDRKYLY